MKRKKKDKPEDEPGKVPGGPFRKGHDPRRNTKGRPPGSFSFRSILERIGNEHVQLTDEDQREGKPGDIMTKSELLARKVYTMALHFQDKWAITTVIERVDGRVDVRKDMEPGEEGKKYLYVVVDKESEEEASAGSK